MGVKCVLSGLEGAGVIASDSKIAVETIFVSG
jgi:hypothetical protein